MCSACPCAKCRVCATTCLCAQCFMLQELGLSPYPLLWLRYTTFIPLYPLGVASEMTMVALAVPHIRKSHMWSLRMPNSYNFAFDYLYFCLLCVAIYIPGKDCFSSAPACSGRWALLSCSACMTTCEHKCECSAG